MNENFAGVKGTVTDDQGAPVAAAVVQVAGIEHNVTTTAGGEFWRLLTPGTYTLAVSAPGHEDSAAQTVVVTNAGEAAVQNFSLVRRGASEPSSQPEAASAEDTKTSETLSEDGFLTPPEFNYHHYDDLQVPLNSFKPLNYYP